MRERFFTPRLRVKSLEELNVWLLDKCVAYAKAHKHPEQTDQTIWQMFEAERGSLVPYVGSFDGFHCVPASVSKTCTVRFDNNKYSVLSTAVGRPVEVHAYADRVVVKQDGRSSPNIGAASDEARRSMIPGTMSCFWPANRRSSQWRAVPRLGNAGCDGEGPQAIEGSRWRRSANGHHSRMRAGRRYHRCRGRLPGGALIRASARLRSSSTYWRDVVIRSDRAFTNPRCTAADP